MSAEVPGVTWTKELIEEADDEKHIFAYKVVDGEVLQKYSSFRVTWEFKSQVGGSGTDVNWTAAIVPLATAASKGKEGNQEDEAAAAEADRRENLYRESAELLLKQLETHLQVTGEYDQPSAMDRMRGDLLLN